MDYESVAQEIPGVGSMALFHFFWDGRVVRCLVHRPGHWLAIVPPPASMPTDASAIICDSLYTSVFACNLDEVGEFFAVIAARHAEQRQDDQPLGPQLEDMGEWSCYAVCRRDA